MKSLTPTAPLHYKAARFSGWSFKNRIGRWRNAVLGATLVLGFLAAGEARAQSKPSCLGLSLPAGSKKLDGGEAKECRFVSSLNWDDTVRFFDRQLPNASTRWHREVNIPAAKYRHVENTNGRAKWEGLNIYQVGGDSASEVRLFVIPRPEPPKAKEKVDASKKDKKKGKKKSK